MRNNKKSLYPGCPGGLVVNAVLQRRWRRFESRPVANLPGCLSLYLSPMSCLTLSAALAKNIKIIISSTLSPPYQSTVPPDVFSLVMT